jgi:hypothetical protein
VAVCFFHRLSPHEVHLTLNAWKISFVNYVKYPGVVFDKRNSWRFHIEIIEAKAFRTFIRVSFLVKSEQLNDNIKVARYKTLIR